MLIFFTYFSNPNISSKTAIITGIIRTIIEYIRVIFHPNKASINAITAGSKNGDVNKNAIVGPKGALTFNNPARIGTVEQEQKGVNVPNINAFI